MNRILCCFALLAASVGICGAQAPEIVGPDAAGRTLLPTRQVVQPAGDAVQFAGRPVDLALAPDHKTLYVKDNRGVVVVDTAQWKVTQEEKLAGGTSMNGIVVSADGEHLYVTNAQNELAEGEITPGMPMAWKRRIALSPDKQAYPCGVALDHYGLHAFVCLSRLNTLGVVDLINGKLESSIPVGVAPWGVVLARSGFTAYVSNWGGRRPRAGEMTAPSAGTPTLIDARGVASSGSISIIDLISEKEVAQVETGLHPCAMVLNADETRLYVANANSDTISVIDTERHRLLQTISVRPHPTLLYGSAPTGLILSPDGKTLYVTNGGNNAVAVIALDYMGRRDAVRGLIPTGWYPGAVVSDGKNLYIANVKGLGSRGVGASGPGSNGPATNEKGQEKGYNVFLYTGTVNRVPLPTADELRRDTEQSLAANRVSDILLAEQRTPDITTPPRHGAGRHGSAPHRPRKALPAPALAEIPGYYRHLIYIIKENRTYDQLFGDLTQGNGDPALCVFGRDVTPNHHALAEQFVLLDNFYCNGVLSADGHSWATEGNVTDHLEKAFGGFARSYTFGDDPLTYSSSGFIWDDFLIHGLSFRNYGEMDYASPSTPADFAAIYRDYTTGAHKIGFTHNIGIENLRRYSSPNYPGWNLSIPDVVRADIFLQDLHRYELKGELPNLVVLYLPNDHTGGDISARSYLADNDLALGRVVDGISHSRFWATSCVFVVEDDPQAGFDHVDGHRSLCLVAGPYVKRGVVIHNFYNQTSVLHSMERMLHLPPMNQMDARAPLMNACFNHTTDLRPYNALPNTVPIPETKHALNTLRRQSAFWQALSSRVRFDRPDASDDDALNRILWHATRGETVAYPAHLAGAHGTGLPALGLKAAPASHLRASKQDDDGDEEMGFDQTKVETGNSETGKHETGKNEIGKNEIGGRR